MRLIVIILLGACFALNSPILQSIYDTTDYDQYVEFIRVRNIVYECMFAAFFTLVFSLSKGLNKSVALFFSALAFGSVVDKISGITWYLPSDIILVVASLILSFYYHVRKLRSGN